MNLVWTSNAKGDLNGAEEHDHQGNDSVRGIAARASGEVGAIRHDPANDKAYAGNHKTDGLAQAVDFEPDLR